MVLGETSINLLGTVEPTDRQTNPELVSQSDDFSNGPSYSIIVKHNTRTMQVTT